MKVSYDEAKRERTLRERSLDFADAETLFDERYVTKPDLRRDYGEDRWITTGILNGDVIVIVWTERHGSRRIISMRRTHVREREAFYRALG